MARNSMLNGKALVTIVVVSALTNVALSHLASARKGA